MAGVKGKSGGRRPGAGRKAQPVITLGLAKGDSLDFLRGVIRDETADPKLRVRAAIAVAQYEHTKTHDGGKKDAIKETAKAVAGGKFAPASAPPKLVVNNR